MVGIHKLGKDRKGRIEEGLKELVGYAREVVKGVPHKRLPGNDCLEPEKMGQTYGGRNRVNRNEKPRSIKMKMKDAPPLRKRPHF